VYVKKVPKGMLHFQLFTQNGILRANILFSKHLFKLESAILYPGRTIHLSTAAPADQETVLLQQCLSGDQQAQFLLYHRYVTAMFNTVVRMVVQTDAAEDVLQIAFSKVFQQLHRFRGESTLGAWIKKIVVNTALQHLRDKNKLSLVPISEHWDQADEVYDEPDDFDAAALHEAIKQLPDGCRVVFSLFAVEEMSHKAIADSLGISESTSKTQYMRAKKLLRARLTNSKLWIP
jgi:RNA polymerase sigma factor (sigma-70 family)